MKDSKNTKAESFENALSRLEELVHALEEGSAGLDDSLKLFEEGIGLVRYCTEKLDEAEQRVKILMENAEGLHEEDFPKEG
jgi:exodeoxyribonuclease VII small subunit